MSVVTSATVERDAVAYTASELIELFKQSFQTDFFLFQRDGKWQSAGCDCSVQEAVGNFELTKTGSQSVLIDCGDAEKQVLVVSLQIDYQDVIIAGAIPRQSPVQEFSSLRLAESLLKNWKQESEIANLHAQIESFAVQVTADFEELSWLRQLTRSVDLCDSRNPLSLVSEKLLPELCGLIQSQSLYLFPPDTNSEHFEFAGECQSSELVQAARWAIEEFRSETVSGPLVRNEFGNTSEATELGIRNLIVVRLAKGTRLIGWLVAINRMAVTSPLPNGSCQSNEFGSFEAGLVSAAGTILGNHGLNSRLFTNIEQLLTGSLRTLVNAIDAKDSYTAGHSDRVALLARRLCEELGGSELEQRQIYITGLLHDTGKIGLPDSVLGKPGRLTDEEFAVIKKHPDYGYQILRHIEQLQFVLPGVLHHHESFDGSGYPHGLAGKDIPYFARIIAVCDAFDAMTSDRPYRSGMPFEKAYSILREGADKQWQAEIVDAIVACEQYAHEICHSNSKTTQRLLTPSENLHNDEISNAIGLAIDAIL